MPGIVLDIIITEIELIITVTKVLVGDTDQENIIGVCKSLTEVYTGCCYISEEGSLIQSGVDSFCGKLFGGYDFYAE